MAWFNPSWTYRIPITINSDSISLAGDLTNHPIRVYIDNSYTDFWSNVQADGDDVRFTASNGTTELDYEITYFNNSTDQAIYEVEVGTLSSSSDTVIYIYYGNSGATSGDDKEGTWRTEYSAVYHLQLNGPVSYRDDATSYNNILTDNGTSNVSGHGVGTGRTFVKSQSDNMTASDSASISFGDGSSDSAFSVAFSVNFSDATSSYLIGKGAAGGDPAEWQIYSGGTDKVTFLLFDHDGNNRIGRATNSAITSDEGTWHRWVVAYDGGGVDSGITIYKDGSVVASSAVTPAGTYVAIEDTSTTLNIGKKSWPTPTGYCDADIDEVYVLAEEVTADWVKADNASVVGSWISIGAQETSDVDVQADYDILAITEKTSSVTLNNNISCSTDSLIISSQQANVTNVTEIDVSTDSLSITEQSATISFGITVNATSSSLNVVPRKAGISKIIVPSYDELIVTGKKATIQTGDVFVSCTKQALILAEQQSDTNFNKSVSTSVDSLSVTEYGVDLTIDVDVPATTDILVITGQTSNVYLSPNIVTVVDALTLTEKSAAVSVDVGTLLAVHNFPSSATVSVRIYDVNNATLVLDWASSNVKEEVWGNGKSSYYFTTSIIEADNQYIVNWKTSDDLYYASEEINYFNSYVPTIKTNTELILAELTGSITLYPDTSGTSWHRI